MASVLNNTSLGTQRTINQSLKDLFKKSLTGENTSDEEMDSLTGNILKQEYAKIGKEVPAPKKPDAPKEDDEKSDETGSAFDQQMQGRKVALMRSSGDLLGASKEMQEPNYKLGSGSSLNQPARSISPESAKLRTAARRLRRQGYTAQAGEMAGMAEMERLNEPRIVTEAQRNRMGLQDMERDVKAEEERKSNSMLDTYMKRRLNKGLSDLKEFA